MDHKIGQVYHFTTMMQTKIEYDQILFSQFSDMRYACTAPMGSSFLFYIWNLRGSVIVPRLIVLQSLTLNLRVVSIV